jgi:hypothetical protein
MARDNEEPAETDEELPPSFTEELSAAFAAALSRAGFAKVAPGTMPHSRDLIAALGGVRGLVESIVPSLAFLVAYTISAIVLNSPSFLLWSVGAPVVCAVVFIVARAVARSQLRSAITGAVIAAITAGLALITGRAADSFVVGIGINAVVFVVILVSLVVRRPIIGLIVGLLTSDEQWRVDSARRRVLTIATWMWLALFAVRLAVELPLYIGDLATGLAISKLVLGVPLYAMLLWVTWLLVGTVYSTAEPSDRSAEPG